MAEPRSLSASATTSREPTQVEEKNHGTKRAFAVNMVITLACPCVPAAQVASAVGKSYLAALIVFGGLYVFGGITYGIAANAENTFVHGASIVSTYVAQTATFVFGPFAAFVVAFYKYANARWSGGMGTLIAAEDEYRTQLDAARHVSSTSVNYIGSHLLFNVALAIGIYSLHQLLNRRLRFDKNSGCCTALAIICFCASCSLFEMIWVVKDAAKTPPFHLGAIDELPAFDATTTVGNESKQPVSPQEIAACPA